MNSSTDRLEPFRQRMFPYLPGHELDEVFAEAVAYHEAHPPLEEGLVRDTNTPLPEGVQHRQGMVDQINQNTADVLLEEHTEKTIYPFVKRSVPPDLARELVDALLLKR